MTTLNQAVRGARSTQGKTKGKNPRKGFGAPQRSGIVLLVRQQGPKKPNSARRSICKIRSRIGNVFAYIRGEGHNLQTHSKVLFQRMKRKDLISISNGVIRGAKGYDCAAVKRSTSRSKYGCQLVR